MTEFLLNFLGVKIEDAQQVTSISLQLRHSSWLGWVFFFALVLGGFGWWSYRSLGGHKDLAPRKRRPLTILRIALLLLMLLILLRPVVSFTLENRIRQTLIGLIDRSASMDIRDGRQSEEDLKRVAIAKGEIKRLDQSTGEKTPDLTTVSRSELMKMALENKDMAVLEKLKSQYDLAFFEFDRDVAAATQDQALLPGAAEDDARQASALGDAIRDVIGRKRGQPVAGIFLVTDGASNSGSEPLDAASAAAQEGMRLYIYGVGITSPRDIIVGSVFTQDVAFIDDQVSVTVRLRGRGMQGTKSKLTLTLGSEEVATKEIDFETEGEQVIPITFTPKKTGEFELTASIAPREDETVKDNNSASQRLRVIDSKIKVLFVEQSPRWEFRHIQSVLMRDRRLDSKFWLLEVDKKFTEGTNSPYLPEFPKNKEELFKYDLIIVGDVNAKVFTPEQQEAIAEFVSKFGGACIFLAGQKGNPGSFAGTPFEKMLPVEGDTSSSTVLQRALSDRPTRLALTSQGKASSLLKLSPEDAENEKIWRKFEPILWINRVSRAKPGAQVLLEDTDPAKTNRFGKMPAMALHQYGLGQVLYMGTDDTWRWRQEANIVYYPVLWGQLVQRMAMTHLLGGSKRTQLSAEKQRYTTGERVTVFARLYDTNFEPVKQPSVTGNYSVAAEKGAQAGPKQEVQMRAMPDQPGMYRGEFVAIEPGLFNFSVESDPTTILEMDVAKPRFELGETAMNEPLLKEMARIGEGDFFREETLGDLPEKLSEKDERITRVVDADLWSSPFYFIILATLATSEWVLRKRRQLK